MNPNICADLSATGGKDFDPDRLTSKSVTFEPGATTAVVNVTLLADDIDENTETFKVVMLPDPNSRILFFQNVTTVAILDSDGKFYHSKLLVMSVFLLQL